MPEETNNSTGQFTQRPLFLTVLCVLTFLGSIAGIAVNIKGYLNAPAEVEKISSGAAKSQLKNLFSGGDNAATELVKIGNLNVGNYEKFSIGCIAAYLLCFIGSVLMFKLKRTGFYSFTLGTFFMVITHFLLFGDQFGAMGFSVFPALGGLVLIILFGMNLKYMEETIEAEEG
jgi:hypothetical protein